MRGPNLPPSQALATGVGPAGMIARRPVFVGLLALPVLGLGACASSPGLGVARDGATAERGPAIGADALVTAIGRFAGQRGHAVEGGVRVVRTGGQWLIAFDADFAAEPVPAAVVGLGSAGFDPAAVLGPLRATSGAQRYALTEGLDIGDYTQVWLWDRTGAAPVALAELTLT